MNDIQIVQYNNIRVLTTQQVAEAYWTSIDTVTRNFNRNKDRYTEGRHYIALEGEEKNAFIDLGQIDRGLKKCQNSLPLDTERLSAPCKITQHRYCLGSVRQTG